MSARQRFRARLYTRACGPFDAPDEVSLVPVHAGTFEAENEGGAVDALVAQNYPGAEYATTGTRGGGTLRFTTMPFVLAYEVEQAGEEVPA